MAVKHLFRALVIHMTAYSIANLINYEMYTPLEVHVRRGKSPYKKAKFAIAKRKSSCLYLIVNETKDRFKSKGGFGV